MKLQPTSRSPPGSTVVRTTLASAVTTALSSRRSSTLSRSPTRRHSLTCSADLERARRATSGAMTRYERALPSMDEVFVRVVKPS